MAEPTIIIYDEAAFVTDAMWNAVKVPPEINRLLTTAGEGALRKLRKRMRKAAKQATAAKALSDRQQDEAEAFMAGTHWTPEQIEQMRRPPWRD